AASFAGGPCTAGASLDGSTFVKIASRSDWESAKSMLARITTADRVAGSIAFQALNPLTAPPCERTRAVPWSRIDSPQPYPLERPSESRRDVVMVPNEVAERTFPSIRARSQASRSRGVDQRPPADPTQPSPSAMEG